VIWLVWAMQWDEITVTMIPTVIFCSIVVFIVFSPFAGLSSVLLPSSGYAQAR